VQVFVIRDDSVPVDDVVVGLHDDILRQSCVRLSVLFRYDDPQVWDSFLSLAKALADRWTADDCDLNDLRSRLRGYYAHPKAEENKKLALPMAHSILLIVDSTGPSLYNYDVNPEVAARQQQAGHSDEDAQRQALVLLPGWKDKARLIAGWAGARRTPGLDPNRWVEIDWSPLPST
jgi:hypothetical protein